MQHFFVSILTTYIVLFLYTFFWLSLALTHIFLIRVLFLVREVSRVSAKTSLPSFFDKLTRQKKLYCLTDMPLTIFPFCHLFSHFLFDLETSRMVLENNNSNCFLNFDSSGPGSLKVGTAMVDAVLLHTGAKPYFLSKNYLEFAV